MADGPDGPSQPHFHAVSREIKQRIVLHPESARGDEQPYASFARPLQRAPAERRGRERPASAAMRRELPRILLVDDDADVLHSTREFLQEAGYEVLVARDGARALACAERDAPDLVVLDIVMPHQSGLSVLQRLRRGYKDPPKIVVVTGNAEPKVRQYAHSAGVDAFVSKPFDIDQLLATIESLLGER